MRVFFHAKPRLRSKSPHMGIVGDSPTIYAVVHPLWGEPGEPPRMFGEHPLHGVSHPV